MTPSIHTPCDDVPLVVDSLQVFHHMMHELVEYKIPKHHIRHLAFNHSGPVSSNSNARAGILGPTWARCSSRGEPVVGLHLILNKMHAQIVHIHICLEIGILPHGDLARISALSHTPCESVHFLNGGLGPWRKTVRLATIWHALWYAYSSDIIYIYISQTCIYIYI